MIANPIRERWADNKPVLNGWLSIGNSFTAELMAAAGYDSITADLQHGAIDDHAVLTMFQAMRASGVGIMARVPWLDGGAVMRALDAGALGIICPMINTPEEAARLVSFVRYPPLGTRSFGPTRASVAHGSDYGANADESVLCWAMIETLEAFERVEEIAATPGLDGLYIGPADLTLALTGRRHRTGFDREEPEMLDAIQRILRAAHAAGIRAGLHTGTPAYAARAVGWGFDLVTVSNDVRLLASAAESSVAAFRSSLETRAAVPAPAVGNGGY